MNSHLVNNNPVAGTVFAFDDTDEFSDKSPSSSGLFGKTIQPACSDQIPSLRDLAIHRLVCTLSKEPEKILPARLCSKLNKKDIHDWLNRGDKSDRRLIGCIPKKDYLEIQDAYRIRSGKKAEELVCTLKEWVDHATENEPGSGFNSIGFVGGGTGCPWAISRQLLPTDEQAVSFPFCLSDIDDSIKDENYYRPCDFDNIDQFRQSPTSSSSSYSTGSFYSAKSSFSEEDPEEKKAANYPLNLLAPPELKCTQKEHIYIYKIGQYNAIDLVNLSGDGIISFAVLGDKNKPLAVVVQVACRESLDFFDIDNYVFPLLENSETMASYAISQYPRWAPALPDEKIKIAFEWIVNDSCRDELFQKCIGPCKPSKFGILPLPEEDETTDAEPEGVPIPHPR